MLGLTDLGLELDASACATRRAAGHLAIQADASLFPVEQLAGKIWGSVYSPPCVTFSAAGNGAGNAVTDILAAGIRDMFAGRKTRALRRREMTRALRASRWLAGSPVPQPDGKTWRRDSQAAWKRQLLARSKSRRLRQRAMAPTSSGPHLTRTQRSARIRESVLSASLVLEPARFIAAGLPEWVALEQVPSVLPLWQVYAEELRKLGYSVWCGTLNSANYGVPQTRIRAILIASRVRTVRRPEPTHYDPRKGMQLWGTPWVSMADALGFGATERPGPAVTAGGTATGGAEPFPTRARTLLEAERDAGRWALRRSRGEGMLDREGRGGRRDHPLDEPAPTITSAGAKVGANLTWVLHTNRDQRPDGSRQTADPRSAPAPAPALTAKSGGQWVLRSGNQPHAAQRPAPAPAPAPTMAFGHNAARMTWKFRNNNNNACERSMDEPAGTLFFGGRSNWAAWVTERPAAVDSVRITVQEAAILQSFRPDYPWQGSKTAQFSQCGNAWCPRAAAAVIGEATGMDWQSAVAREYGESEAAA